jgi:carboxylesterase type B
VVLVALDYRLGALGFLDSPDAQKDGLANAGLHDQRFALRWIQKYIYLFGGDLEKVMVWGGSAGGGSIVHQITVCSYTQVSANFGNRPTVDVVTQPL